MAGLPKAERLIFLWIVDAGLTLTEAQNINRSLLELGNVISALMQQSNHVPYRHVPFAANSIVSRHFLDICFYKILARLESPDNL